MLSMLGTLGEYMPDIPIISRIMVINNISLLIVCYASYFENSVRTLMAQTALCNFISPITYILIRFIQ